VERAAALEHALDHATAPVLEVDAGELFAVETEDASWGLLTAGDVEPLPENLPYLDHHPAWTNPVAGPVLVRGIRAGARVKVEIEAIELAPTGVTWSRPAMTPDSVARRWPELGEPHVTPIEHRDGDAVVGEHLRWPLAPMIGTLACAPEWEVRSSGLAQGPWGGNLDVADLAPGATVYLNGYHEGALLFVGDVHGCQGDGEYSGAGDESRAVLHLRVSEAPGEPLPFPRVETPDRLVALACAKPLEAAADAAVCHLLEWLVTELDFSPREAYLAVSLDPEFRLRVYQMTAISGLLFTVGASLPRAHVEAPR
jgi:acetamidase/formamidase